MDRENQPLDNTVRRDGSTARERSTSDVDAQLAAGLRLDTTTIAIWLAIVVAMVAVLLLARITVHGAGFDRTMRVADVWSTMAEDLPNVSRQSILKTVYYTSIAVTLLGAFAAILIALAARDPEATVAPSGSMPDDGSRQPDAMGSGD